MKKKGLKLFLILFAVAIGLVLVAAAGFYVRGPSLIKDKLQEQVIAGLGEEAEIQCEVETRLVPFGFTYSNLLLKDGEQELLKADSGAVILDWWSLISGGSSRIDRLELNQPIILLPLALLEESEDKEDMVAPALVIDRLVVSHGRVRTLDSDGNSGTLIDGLDMELNDVARSGSGQLQFTGDLTAEEFNIPKLNLTKFSGTIKGDDRHYLLDNLEALVFGSNVSGRWSTDLSGEKPSWRLRLYSDSFSLDELFQTLASQKMFTGTVEAGVELAGLFDSDFLAHLSGTLKMRGSDLTQYGFDLDNVIEQLQASRNINLVDIGLFAFAGPLGALASQGVSFARLATAAERQDQQQVEQLVFNWHLDDGIATTEDVAFRTRKNRIAIKGTVDLVRSEYKELSLALLNTEGCALIEQDISGPLKNPEIHKTGMLGTLADSILGILKQGWEIVDVTECEVYYQGRIKPHQKK